MAIQNRRGADADFDASKMLPAEIAITTDGSRKVYAAFAPGDAKELASKEDVQEIIDEFNAGVKKNIQMATEKITKEATEQIQAIEDKAEEILADVPSYEEKLAELDLYKANSILCKSSGTTIVTTDSANAKPNIKTYGKSKMNTIPGNQLFDASLLDKQTYVTVDENGWITINNTGSSVFYTQTESIYLNNTYSVSVEFKDTTSQFYLQTRESDYSHSLSKTGSIQVTTTDFGRIMFAVGRGESITFRLMVNVGDAKDWEPFVGGEASPNMKYPQKAEFLGESGSIGGKVLTNQLLDVSKLAAYTDSDDWMTIPIDNTDGTTIKYFTCMIPVSDLIEVGKDYLAVLEIKENTLGSEVIAVSTANSDKSQFVTTFTATNPGTYIKKVTASDDFTDSKTMTRTVLQAKAGTSGRVVFRLSIIEDTTVTADTFVYDPYTEQPFTSLTPNGLHGIPLGQTIPDAIKNSPIHMSGVYWDGEQYQIADTENEDGKDVQRILENTFDGSDDERWKLETTSLGYRYSIALNTPVLTSDTTNGATSMNTSSQLGRSGSTWTVPNCYTVNLVDGVYYLYISLNGTETLEEFKTLLAENPMSVYCVLAEPIVTDKSEEEIAQLDALVMNYPNTTIVNDAGAYMEVEYVADTKEHIKQNYTPNSITQDILTRLSALELNALNS